MFAVLSIRLIRLKPRGQLNVPANLPNVATQGLSRALLLGADDHEESAPGCRELNHGEAELSARTRPGLQHWGSWQAGEEQRESCKERSPRARGTPFGRQSRARLVLEGG